MTESNDFLDNLANHQHQKMLREIANDDITPKKHDFRVEKELHEPLSEDSNEDEQISRDQPIPLVEF